jgi:hypothetical protein
LNSWWNFLYHLDVGNGIAKNKLASERSAERHNGWDSNYVIDKDTCKGYYIEKNECIHVCYIQ